jgi:hypothetical protein
MKTLVPDSTPLNSLGGSAKLTVTPSVITLWKSLLHCTMGIGNDIGATDEKNITAKIII